MATRRRTPRRGPRRQGTRSQHAEWLRLVEVSGPFLELPVLTALDVFPQGLPTFPTETRQDLFLAYEEWTANGDDRAIHRQWVRYVLRLALDYPDDIVRARTDFAKRYDVPLPEHRTTLEPDLAIIEPADSNRPERARMLVQIWPPDQDLECATADQTWKATPAARMAELLRRHDGSLRLGLCTNGEQWILVHAPPEAATTWATWRAELWFDEPVTLQAFRALLGAERLIGSAAGSRLEDLFDRSAAAAHELTDQLGLQVRLAVERLVKAIDEVDRSRNRELLRNYDDKRLYQASLTVMMRLVFLFYAEENRLLPLDDPFYQQHYAVTPMREQLLEDRDRLTDEVLHRRHAAWCRLLATFRAVHAGVEHESMRLPAYGGALFDPDRFPFLEGRTFGTNWRETPADPLPIDDLTVLQLLQALQELEVPGAGRSRETRPLSFRSLGVEQIGHVYEGLLDHTAVRADGPVLGLVGKKGIEPEVPVTELEGKSGRDLPSFVAEVTGKTPNQIGKLRGLSPIDDNRELWMRACYGDAALLERLRPFAPFVREEHGLPVVIPHGSVYVTAGTDRRSTGTHYTPPSLTEPIVKHALDPLVYEGPAGGEPEENWRLRPPREILALKVCDLACGSGAFLVQACRYLSERLVESWARLEQEHEGKVLVSPEGELEVTSAAERPIPKDDEERKAIARRVVADRCLYGVDVDPMAVEMAKLSLWLITLQKDRPFTFLDHAIRCGDSLLGVHDPEQLAWFHLDPDRGQVVHKWKGGVQAVARQAIEDAVELRTRLESFPVLDVRDAERKAELLRKAEALLADLRLAGDLLVGVGLETAGRNPKEFDDRVRDLGREVAKLLDPETSDDDRVRVRAALVKEKGDLLSCESHPVRRPFHWALEFPEVFLERDGKGQGLSAIVGNPPFVGGKKITGIFGTDYREFLVQHLAWSRRGHADLVAYFFLRVFALLAEGGTAGLLATNTIAQGDTREVGLDQLVERGASIPRAVQSRKWPGIANLEVAHVWLYKGIWKGRHELADEPVSGITPYLTVPGRVKGKPYHLAENKDKSFIGSYVLGMGFVLTPDQAYKLIDKDPKNKDVLFPYLNGKDLNSRPDQSPSRWVINFFDWPEERAREYPDVFRVVEERVKPERQSKKARDVASAPWWQFWRLRSELYSTIAGMDRVLVRARVSNLNSIAFVPHGVVASEATVVFAFDQFGFLGLLQSTFHTSWIELNASSLRTDIRYTPSDCFDTFPFPRSIDAIEVIGKDYEAHRAACCSDLKEGLTKIYNRVHRRDRDRRIDRLRDLHVAMDKAVAHAYGWDDLQLDHNFRGSGNACRFTVSDSVRQEILDRLLELNHQRHALESREPKKRKATSTLFDID